MVQIATRNIGLKSPPFVVAELSGNHGGSLEEALTLVEQAARNGADAIKLQTYTADSMTLDSSSPEYLISDRNSPWFGRSLFQIYQEGSMPKEWHKILFEKCESEGVFGFSTPFDSSAVEFLDGLGVPCYKIASFELTDIPLVRCVADTGKPIILSTGMATEGEISDAVENIRKTGNNQIILLRCTSTYPAKPKYANLLTLSHMRQLFSCEVGLSDHTLGLAAASAAVAHGATFVEKHFTLSRTNGYLDSSFSIEPSELKLLVSQLREVWESLGAVHYGPTEEEKLSVRYRRSLYVVCELEKGQTISADCIKSLRPSIGIEPKFMDSIIGKRTKCAINSGSPLTWDMIE